jgi:hypothetical protein
MPLSSRGRLGCGDDRGRERQGRHAGVPVARTSGQVLNDLSDDAIHALVDEIRASNSFLDDADIVRLLVQRVEAPGYRGDVAEARRAGSRAPGPYEDLTPALKRDAALDELRAKAVELRKVQPGLSEAQSFAKAYRLYPDLAARERQASRAALYA